MSCAPPTHESAALFEIVKMNEALKCSPAYECALMDGALWELGLKALHVE